MLRRRKQTLKTSQREPRRREYGLQLVEAAFVMPIMVMLLGGIAEFGRYFHMRSTMLRATMAGAVYMSDKTNSNTELLAAKRMAVCGQTTTCSSTQLLYPGVTDTNMTVTISGNVIAGQYVTVATSNVRYAPVFRISQMTGNSRQWWNIPITVQTKMRYFGS